MCFHLPDEAAVDHMRMYIGDRFIEGEIQREGANCEERTYEQAKIALARKPVWSNNNVQICSPHR